MLKTGFSDHCLVYCTRKLHGSIKHEHKYSTSQQLKNFNQEAFLSDLSEVVGRHLWRMLRTMMIKYESGPSCLRSFLKSMHLLWEDECLTDVRLG